MSFGTITPHYQLQILLVQDCASQSRGFICNREEEESWLPLRGLGSQRRGHLPGGASFPSTRTRPQGRRIWRLAKLTQRHRKEGPIGIYTTVMKNNSNFERFRGRSSRIWEKVECQSINQSNDFLHLSWYYTLILVWFEPWNLWCVQSKLEDLHLGSKRENWAIKSKELDFWLSIWNP